MEATSWLSHTSILSVSAAARKQRQHVEGYQKIYYKTGVMEIPLTPRHTHMQRRRPFFLYCEDNDGGGGGGITLCMTHSYFMICSQNYARAAREKRNITFLTPAAGAPAARERESENLSFSAPLERNTREETKKKLCKSTARAAAGALLGMLGTRMSRDADKKLTLGTLSPKVTLPYSK